MTSNQETALALPPEPIPRDLVKEIAMDIGKEVAAYIERMYPEAVAAASSTFLLSVRNCIYNQILASLETTRAEEIADRLIRRKKDRRQLRAIWKAARNVRPGEFGKVDAILRGDVPLEPDL
jgi:hypothetical protein